MTEPRKSSCFGVVERHSTYPRNAVLRPHTEPVFSVGRGFKRVCGECELLALTDYVYRADRVVLNSLAYGKAVGYRDAVDGADLTRRGEKGGMQISYF